MDGAEGSERGTEARSAGVTRGGVWEGRRSPSTVWGSGGIAPQKILKFNSANLFIFSTISRQNSSSIRCFSFSVRNLHCILLLHITLQQSQLHTSQSQLHTSCQKTHNFRPCPVLIGIPQAYISLCRCKII